jgi:hypothetical protein
MILTGENWVWSIGGMILTGKNWITGREPCPTATLSTKLTRTDLGSNPCLRGDRPWINRLNHNKGIIHYKTGIPTAEYRVCGPTADASQLKLYSEKIAVCSQIHTKHINTLCGQNVKSSNVQPGGPKRIKYWFHNEEQWFDIRHGNTTVQNKVTSTNGMIIS